MAGLAYASHGLWQRARTPSWSALALLLLLTSGLALVGPQHCVPPATKSEAIMWGLMFLSVWAAAFGTVAHVVYLWQVPRSPEACPTTLVAQGMPGGVAAHEDNTEHGCRRWARRGATERDQGPEARQGSRLAACCCRRQGQRGAPDRGEWIGAGHTGCNGASATGRRPPTSRRPRQSAHLGGPRNGGGQRRLLPHRQRADLPGGTVLTQAALNNPLRQGAAPYDDNTKDYFGLNGVIGEGESKVNRTARTADNTIDWQQGRNT